MLQNRFKTIKLLRFFGDVWKVLTWVQEVVKPTGVGDTIFQYFTNNLSD